jgi:AcrR family transcriptional regulator
MSASQNAGWAKGTTSLPSKDARSVSQNADGGKRKRRSHQERNDEMRAALAKAAYDEIAEKGHSEFRTAPVFARAGVSKGAMQHYFPSKDALTLAAVEYSFGLSSEASHKLLRTAATDSEAVIRLLFEDLAGYFGDNRFWVSLDITLHAAKSAHLAAGIRDRIYRARQPLYRQWADRLIAAGWSEANATMAVTTATALVSGGAIRNLWTELDEGLQAIWIGLVRSIEDA